MQRFGNCICFLLQVSRTVTWRLKHVQFSKRRVSYSFRSPDAGESPWNQLFLGDNLQFRTYTNVLTICRLFALKYIIFGFVERREKNVASLLEKYANAFNKSYNIIQNWSQNNCWRLYFHGDDHWDSSSLLYDLVQSCREVPACLSASSPLSPALVLVVPVQWRTGWPGIDFFTQPPSVCRHEDVFRQNAKFYFNSLHVLTHKYMF
jgi:hypothetical protein